MAKPYQEGKGWWVRKRYQGNDIYVSGKESKAAAEKALRQEIAAIDAGGKPQHLGPKRTTLAHALQAFGLEHLPHLKGAPQEVRRINRYLEAAGVQSLAVQPAAADSTMHYEVTLKPVDEQRRVPQGLGEHRTALLTRTVNADRVRKVLAQTPVANITELQLQRLFDALAQSGLAPATIGLERAVLRRFFNHARKRWAWAQPGVNPAVDLKLPRIDNARDRVLSLKEQDLLDAELDDARHAVLRHVVVLLRETAMRASEPLLHATWAGVDWERRVLQLSDGKDGKRDVPLSPVAIEALRALGPGKPHQKIVALTYEALKAGVRKACKRAGIEDLHIQDLRHTAATRLGLDTGNIFLVQALTGHKTLAMAKRYVNVKADDVVAVLHGERAAPQAKPAEVVCTQSESTPAPSHSPNVLDAAQMQSLVARAVSDAMALALRGVQPPVSESSNVAPLRRAA